MELENIFMPYCLEGVHHEFGENKRNCFQNDGETEVTFTTWKGIYLLSLSKSCSNFFEFDHDVAKGIEPHSKTGAHLIKALLEEECSPNDLDLISSIIEYHNKRNQDSLPFHIKIVQDADVLDHFGSLEIWLKFLYSGHTEENVFDAIQLWEGWSKDTFWTTISRAL